MDERELLILGLLKAQSQHGYQINEFIERNLGTVSDMKKSTAYSVLKRLDKGGFVSSETEQEGNRPPRQVFSITERGAERFEELLRHWLAQVDDTTPAGDIGVMFLDHLPPEEVARYLRQRLAKVEAKLQMNESVPGHGHGIGVDLSVRHRIALLKADREWLLDAIRQVEASPPSQS